MKNKAATLTLGLVMVAGPALASNTGFKLNFTLRKGTATTSGNNFVSVPTFWFPTGTVGVPGNSLDACVDLNEGDRFNTPKVTQIIRHLRDSGVFKTQNCSASPLVPPIFNIIPGEAYSVKATVDGTVINIVGSNDDDYSKPPKCSGAGCKFFTLRKQGPTTLAGNNFVSVPYHVKANNSLDLCVDTNEGDRFNAVKVIQVIRFDTVADAFKTQSCKAPAAIPAIFNVVPGEGYSFKTDVDNTTINFDVY
jgi:hypothetical protein